MYIPIQSIGSAGQGGIIIDIECHLSNNLPNIVIVGYANKAVDEARERIRGGFASSRIMLPRKRVLLNLAPADVPKADSGFDLAMAVAILAASNQVSITVPSTAAFIGELGLDGSTRAVRGIIGKIMVGRAHGLRTFYIPAANVAQAQLVPDVSLIPVNNLAELHCHLNATYSIPTLETQDGAHLDVNIVRHADTQLNDVIGQHLAKRALAIAAGGGHNLLMTGPPGTGKSMLAKAIPAILPPLNREEMLEVTHLHSLASHNYEQIVAERPFRAPHHGASGVAITGGGATLSPGELSLAHRGVLFFDELPEFNRTVLESLRQPLEDGEINVSRAAGTVTFPANFILVATANPCPCGYLGTDGCNCTRVQIANYRGRLSGPVLDRIDLHCPVNPIDTTELLASAESAESTEAIYARVLQARRLQQARLGPGRLNTDLTNLEIRQRCEATPAAIEKLNDYARTTSLSARAYMRALKVARTIADLENLAEITASHMAEALRYQPQAHSKAAFPVAPKFGPVETTGKA